MIARPIFIEDVLKTTLQHQFERWSSGLTGWMFGYRIHPIDKRRQFHNGIDLPIISGTPVMSPWPGWIDKLWIDDLNGVAVTIRHDGGPISQTGYAHLTEWDKWIEPGKVIEAGQPFAKTGSTGHSTGPHLHFVCRVVVGDGSRKAVDPLPYLAASVGIVEIPTREL